LRRHVFLGLPRLRLAFGVSWSAVFETVSLSVSLSPDDMTYTSPLSLHDDGTNVLWFALYKHILGNGLRLENAQDLSQTFGVETVWK